MVVLDVKLDGIFGFEDFEINFTDFGDSSSPFLFKEHLKGRERFKYKKAVILMGPNASGKTSLGRALNEIMDFLQSGLSSDIYKIASKDEAYFTIDFVTEDNIFYRFDGAIYRKEKAVTVHKYNAGIELMDSYESCLLKLQEKDDYEPGGHYMRFPFSELKGRLNYCFTYPDRDNSQSTDEIERSVLQRTLQAVLETLDPTLTTVSISKDLKNSFIIRRDQEEIIIQDGKLLNRDVLSSGTKEGIAVAFFLASMMNMKAGFYYCDEHFSYIQSDIEKRIFGIMLSYIAENGQLIFTTHNTDMLDLNLPKHSYVFLRKKREQGRFNISAVSASDIIGEDDSSLRDAVENDVFSSLPDDSPLDVLEITYGR